MNILLRSLYIAGPQDNAEQHFKNYLLFESSGLEFLEPQDVVLWQFIKDFAKSYNEVPNISTLRNHFENIREPEVIDRLVILDAVSPLTKGDFQSRLERKVEDRKKILVKEILTQAGHIAHEGIKIQDGKSEAFLRGPVAAIQYVMDEGHEILTPALAYKISGNITKDADNIAKAYIARRDDPMQGEGLYCGFDEIDQALRGAKPKELWTHAAFTGGLKSTFALNWMYNQAVFRGRNIFMISLEMPYFQVRNLLFAMHTMHHKFRNTRVELGIQTDPSPHGDLGLRYERIRDGQLEPNEERFFLEYVVPDLSEKGIGYGAMEVHEPDPNKVGFNVLDLRHKAEMIYSKTPLSMVIVDHGGLLQSQRRYSSTTESQNEVLRDLKRLALTFNGGRGIAVLNLFQINRTGYKEALKNEGRYNLTHLSYANECERSSDVVTASWVDEEYAARNRALFQCLKSRDSRPFQAFEARIEWPCRRLWNCSEFDMSREDEEGLGEVLDEELAKMLED
jgi:hypothetical protein